MFDIDIDADATGIAALAFYFQLTGDSVEYTLSAESDQQGAEPHRSPTKKFFQGWDNFEDRYKAILTYAQARLPTGSRILDVGCHVGRFTRHLERIGYDVVGIDVSPGALWVAKKLGARDVRLLDISKLEQGHFDTPFDAVLLFGHNIGIGGTPKGVRGLLQILKSLSRRGTLLLLDSGDKTVLQDPWMRDQATFSISHKKHPGETTYSVGVGPYEAKPFPWIHVSCQELEDWATPIGWAIEFKYDSTDEPGCWSGAFVSA